MTTTYREERLQSIEKAALIELAHQARVEEIFRLRLTRFRLRFFQSL